MKGLGKAWWAKPGHSSCKSPAGAILSIRNRTQTFPGCPCPVLSRPLPLPVLERVGKSRRILKTEQITDLGNRQGGAAQVVAGQLVARGVEQRLVGQSFVRQAALQGAGWSFEAGGEKGPSDAAALESEARRPIGCASSPYTVTPTTTPGTPVSAKMT